MHWLANYNDYEIKTIKAAIEVNEAPALANIPFLLEDGANVHVWDPVGMDHLREVHDGEVVYCRTIEEALTDADACFIFTEWEEIKRIDLQEFPRLMKTPHVFDGRNCYAVADAKAAGILYESIGRSGRKERSMS